MIKFTFAGHRYVFHPELHDILFETIVSFLKKDDEFVFFTGNMGEFDTQWEAVIYRLKHTFPHKNIKLIWVPPYNSNKINTNKHYYENYFDDIIFPEYTNNTHYKSAITKRNKWLADNCDHLIAYVIHNYGGAYMTLKYAEKKRVHIINIAEYI